MLEHLGFVSVVDVRFGGMVASSTAHLPHSGCRILFYEGNCSMSFVQVFRNDMNMELDPIGKGRHTDGECCLKVQATHGAWLYRFSSHSIVTSMTLLLDVLKQVWWSVGFVKFIWRLKRSSKYSGGRYSSYQNVGFT